MFLRRNTLDKDVRYCRQGWEQSQQGKKRGDIDPLTPTAGTTGGIGRTPVLVAESTRQPGEKPFTPGKVPKGEGSDRRGKRPTHEQDQEESAEGAQGVREGGEPKWALPEPFDPHMTGVLTSKRNTLCKHPPPNLSGIGLGTLRAEYIHMYNRLLDREKQPPL